MVPLKVQEKRTSGLQILERLKRWWIPFALWLTPPGSTQNKWTRETPQVAPMQERRRSSPSLTWTVTLASLAHHDHDHHHHPPKFDAEQWCYSCRHSARFRSDAKPYSIHPFEASAERPAVITDTVCLLPPQGGRLEALEVGSDRLHLCMAEDEKRPYIWGAD
jgi:hypothetical protein